MATILDACHFNPEELGLSGEILELMNTILKERISVGRGRKSRCIIVDDLIVRDDDVKLIGRGLALISATATNLLSYMKNHPIMPLDDYEIDYDKIRKAYMIVRQSIKTLPDFIWEALSIENRPNNFTVDAYKKSTLNCLDSYLRIVEFWSKLSTDFKCNVSEFGTNNQWHCANAFIYLHELFKIYNATISKGEIYRLIGSIIYTLDPKKGNPDAVRKIVERGIRQRQIAWSHIERRKSLESVKLAEEPAFRTAILDIYKKKSMES